MGEYIRFWEVLTDRPDAGLGSPEVKGQEADAGRRANGWLFHLFPEAEMASDRNRQELTAGHFQDSRLSMIEQQGVQGADSGLKMQTESLPPIQRWEPEISKIYFSPHSRQPRRLQIAFSAPVLTP